MKKRKSILIIPVLIIGIIVYLMFFRDSGKSEESYIFSEVRRGNLEILTSSTGTLQPVSLIDVGTQVSGRVDRVYVDYNSVVRSGEVLAILDTLQLSINYRSAKNDLDRAEAQHRLAERVFNDQQKLFEKNFISELEILRSETDLKLAKISLLNAQSNLERAYLNLYDYAVIRSPINGIIIDKNVEEGQTVAASLSAPVLFTIAADMENMEIQAEVDETDIGMIKVGQPVRYTVDSYPDKTFTGVVRNVRLKPQVISNVVIYTVIVSTSNPEGILLPGMTATIDFITSQKKDVLLVPSTALRWRPPEEVIQQIMKQRQEETASGTRQPARPDGERGGGGQMGVNTGVLWSMDSNGRITMNRVRLGDTDGINTEIIPVDEVKEGMKVIVNRVTANRTATSTQAPLGAPQRMRF